MAHNISKICIGCGRTFNSKNSKHPFCSLACKRRYVYHRGFKCSECRTASCTLRNDYSNSVPDGCPNFKWDPMSRR
ncbi:hypothetical protein bpr_II384 (plasmid) [Butyrivibrio proteoclasticus B316]|uniref:Uncharacterized protein n=1 Tax=Butyrivibrio proteoclasticus (strain ATCC 51982 / DSM 14932 / B316) TaxID=515622 RepID=E0S4I9_BUTPB|nr:hypothetical protein bpr_II384 [Butyrivibrio proteoclasticus B316]